MARLILPDGRGERVEGRLGGVEKLGSAPVVLARGGEWLALAGFADAECGS